jgi:hypothetical protein
MNITRKQKRGRVRLLPRKSLPYRDGEIHQPNTNGHEITSLNAAESNMVNTSALFVGGAFSIA